MVWKFKLAHQQKTEAKKMKLFGGTPISAPRKKVKPLKKTKGCQLVDKQGGI